MSNGSSSETVGRRFQGRALRANTREYQSSPQSQKCPACGKGHPQGSFLMGRQCNEGVSQVMRSEGHRGVWKKFPALRWKSEDEIRVLMNARKD